MKLGVQFMTVIILDLIVQVDLIITEIVQQTDRRIHILEKSTAILKTSQVK